MRPDIDLGRQLDAELAARGLKATSFAPQCGVNARTMRAYVSGDLPIPPGVAGEITRALDRRGHFAIPHVRDALVTRGSAYDQRTHPNTLEPIRLVVDTVVLTIEVQKARLDDLSRFLSTHLPGRPRGASRLPGYRAAAHAQVGQGSAWVTAHWNHWSTTSHGLRLQLAPWEPAHCRLLQRLLRCASEREATGLIGRGPVVRFARFDVAFDYPAEVVWLLVDRPLAKNSEVLESKDGGTARYSGKRKDSEWCSRFYNYALRHRCPGPIARIEVQRNLKPQLRPAELDDEKNPFRDLGLGPLFGPDLSVVEAALLRWGLEMGLRWALRHLEAEDPSDAKRLRCALKKAKASPLLESPFEIMERVWRYIPEMLRIQLFWHETEDGELQPWSYPPVLSHDEMTHDSGEART